MARLHVIELDPRSTRLWSIGRQAGLLGLAALLLALVLAPPVALTSLWSIAVPLLPASFFLTPAVWRGICPLSTLNAFGNRFGPAREMTEREATVIGALGLVLFHAIVPARHLGLNTNGPLLAGALVAIGTIAVTMGAMYASRSAFCNALCPVLPVERLYGQSPVFHVTRGRCDTCTVCTPRGCLDLADRKAMRQSLGAPRHGGAWLATPFGVFAAALPGFVVGYGLTPDLGLASAARVYGATLGGSVASYVVVRLVVRATRVTPLRAVAWCAAVSGVLYYWFTAAVAVRNLGLPAPSVPVIRGLAIVALGMWVARDHRQDTART